MVGRIAAWLGAAAVIAFTVAPLLYMVRLSLDPDPVDTASWPPRVSLGNFALLAEPEFGFTGALERTALLTLGVTVVSMAVAVPAGYALARLRLPITRWFLPGMLALAFFPGIVILSTMRPQLAALGLFDTLPGVGLVQLSFTVPLAVWFATYAFRQIPDEVEDAARLDGAGTGRLILQIAVPVARAGLGATTALVALASWSDFLFAAGLSQTDRSETLTVWLAKLPTIGFLGGQMAAGVLVSLPVAAVVGAGLVWLERRAAT